MREATTYALVGIVTISFISLNFLAEDSNVFFAGIMLLSLAWIASTLILPMRAVHRLISRLKQEELERVRAAIRGDRSALADSGIAAEAETLSLADLVAYRDLIASVREWPVQPAAFVRLFLQSRSAPGSEARWSSAFLGACSTEAQTRGAMRALERHHVAEARRNLWNQRLAVRRYEAIRREE